MASTTISVLAVVVVIFRSLVEAVIVGEPLPENVSVAPFPLNVPFPVADSVPVTARPVDETEVFMSPAMTFSITFPVGA